MVRIVTDDGGYIDDKIAEKYNIVVLRHPVYIGEEEVTGVDYRAFCDRLKNGEVSRTTLLSPAYIEDVYRGIEEKDIISVHLSGADSGTINSARKAAESVNDKNIFVVDSLMTCAGEALLAIILADKAIKGATFEELKNEATEIRDNIKFYLIIENLSYLEKSGRIGKAKALLGSVFKIKPILVFNKEGRIEPYGKARTNMQVVNKILGGEKQYKYIIISKTYYSDLQDNVIEIIKNKCDNFFIEGSNNVNSTYLGPVAWTIAMY